MDANEIAYELLKALGTNSQEIAKTLQTGGYKGHSGSSEQCIIVKFIQKEFEGRNVYVRPGLIRFTYNHETIYVAPTQAMDDFLGDFDTGHYPFLKS